jgi:hypothetical protein
MICQDLFHAIDLMDVESALYETGVLLKKENVDILLETWVQTLAAAGRKMRTDDHASVYKLCLDDLWEALSTEHLRVKQCFTLTVKFCMLMRRLYHLRYEPMHLSTYKKKIQILFPEKAQLSEKGLEVYKRILPSNEHPTTILATRIAAGFTRLLDQTQLLDARLSLEYLSRRHLEIKNTFGFVHESDDILWYLWGILRYYYGKNKMEKCWDVFYWNYQNKLKPDRLGLLWSVPWYVSAMDPVDEIWDPYEYDIIEKVKHRTQDLWKQLDEEKGEDILMSYIPRPMKETMVLPPHDEQPKQIRLASSRFEAIQEKGDKDKRKQKDKYETDRINSRDRGVYFG